MPTPFDEQYWQEEFDITQDDLDRITGRMRQERCCFTLTEMAKRVIRGRLEHGVDFSPVVLSSEEQETQVRLWDPARKWQIGDRAIVALQITKEIYEPCVGLITDIEPAMVILLIDGKSQISRFGRAKAGSSDALKWRTFVEELVASKTKAIQGLARDEKIHEQTDFVLLKYGERVTTRLLTVLGADPRFFAFEDLWHLEEMLTLPTPQQLLRLHHHAFQDPNRRSAPWAVADLLALLEPPLADGELGPASLHQALLKDDQGLFENTGTPTYPAWQAMPPPWEQAVSAYYAYDPESYEILLKPGQRLTQQLARRLDELGLYNHVVTVADEPDL